MSRGSGDGYHVVCRRLYTKTISFDKLLLFDASLRTPKQTIITRVHTRKQGAVSCVLEPEEISPISGAHLIQP
jgi:hypothetical protein